MNLSVWGGVMSFTGRSPPGLGLGLEQRLASDYPSCRLQSEKASYAGYSWESQGSFSA